MTIWESLDRNLPPKLSRTTALTKALFGSQDAVPAVSIQTPDDVNSGAIINELYYLREYIRKLSSGTLLDKAASLLDSIVSIFTGVGRLQGEGDSNYLSRFMVIVQRGVPTWGTPKALLGGLSRVLPPSLLLLQESPSVISASNPNLLTDPEFELGGGAWTLSGTAAVVTGGLSFIGSRVLSLPASGDSAKQTITLGAVVSAGSFVVGNQYQIKAAGTTNFTLIGAATNTVGTYFIATGVGTGTGTAYESDYRLCFVAKGTGLQVTIKNTTTLKYWDGATWNLTASSIMIPASAPYSVSTIELPGVAAGSHDIAFIGGAGGGNFVDMVELGIQPKSPYYVVYVSSGGQSTDTSIALTAPTPDDATYPVWQSQQGRFLTRNDIESQAYSSVTDRMSFMGGEMNGQSGGGYLAKVFDILRTAGVGGSIVFVLRS